MLVIGLDSYGFKTNQNDSLFLTGCNEYLFKWGTLFFYLSTHSRLEDLSARLSVILVVFFSVISIPAEELG